MTHEELLAKIQFSRNDFNYVTPHNALRAVVELHKPDENNQCPECEYYWIDEIKFCDYPCPTIQAIEKELA